MLKYQLITDPIYITAFKVMEVGDLAQSYYPYRRCILETGEEIQILEGLENPIKVGDHVRYEIHRDEYVRIDPDNLLGIGPNFKLKLIHSDD